MLPMVAMRSVWPSASARAAASVPTVPLAPARFSTTTGPPRVSASFWPTSRATMSVPPPGGKATMILTGFDGKGCASAVATHASRTSFRKARRIARKYRVYDRCGRKSTMIRRLAVVLLALFTAPAFAQTRIVLGYTPANAFLPAFVAKDKGLFARHGLDVTLQTVPQGSTIAGAMAGGSVQAGTLTPPAFLLAVEGGIDAQIVAVGTLQAKSNPTIALMAKEGSGIKTAADMRGKRIGVPGLNGGNHIVAMKWLQNNGVDPKSATYIETGFPAMGDLLKGGQVEVVMPVERFIRRI